MFRQRIIVFLLLLNLLTACAGPTPTIKPTTSPTVSPIPNASPTSTPVPTSLPPALLPTPTPTPSITPLVTAPTSNYSSSLVEWTPDQANMLIKALEQYPETLQGSDYGYIDAFRYTQLALREALYRFPDSQYSEQWHWAEIYLRMQAGETGFSEAYAQLI
jgi:hypothetical protein